MWHFLCFSNILDLFIKFLKFFFFQKKIFIENLNIFSLPNIITCKISLKSKISFPLHRVINIHFCTFPMWIFCVFTFIQILITHVVNIFQQAKWVKWRETKGENEKHSTLFIQFSLQASTFSLTFFSLRQPLNELWCSSDGN